MPYGCFHHFSPSVAPGPPPRCTKPCAQHEIGELKNNGTLQGTLSPKHDFTHMAGHLRLNLLQKGGIIRLMMLSLLSLDAESLCAFSTLHAGFIAQSYIAVGQQLCMWTVRSAGRQGLKAASLQLRLPGLASGWWPPLPTCPHPSLQPMPQCSLAV